MEGMRLQEGEEETQQALCMVTAGTARQSLSLPIARESDACQPFSACGVTGQLEEAEIIEGRS